jgi:ABC-type lipoprotein release transport system permease subunit
MPHTHHKHTSIFRTNLNAVRVGWFLALRQVKRSSKGTTGLIIFIMVLTFLNLVVVSGLLLGLITGSFVQYRESYTGEVLVTPAVGRDHIEGSQDLIAYLKSDPKVIALSPRYAVNAMVLGTLNRLPEKNVQANEAGARIVGIDPDREEEVTKFSRFVEAGDPLKRGDDGYILIGANLIKKYSAFADANLPGVTLLTDVDVGSRVRITLSGIDGGVISKEFVVKGIIKSKVDEISTRMFVVDDEIKRLIPVNKQEFQEIAVKSDPADAAQIVKETKRFLDYRVARVQTSEEAIPSFLRNIETTMGVLGNALSSIALVVATITVFIVIFINAVTKRKFIGIMKGIGISPAAIQFSYVLIALFYGVVGSAIGAAFTFGLLKPYFDANPIDFPFSDGILVATPEGAALRIAVLIGVTLIAGYIPAKLIIRKNALDAILGR